MNTTIASTWPSMSVDEYAALESAMGAKIERCGGVWWRQVRPFFYRPLLPFLELNPTEVELPQRSRFGGAQFAIPDGTAGDSHIDLLMFEEPRSYSLDTLSPGSRRHIRRAMKSFNVRPIIDDEEFIASGHPVYLSFFERTKYRYKRNRTEPQRFASWARALYRFPRVQVLGAYRGGELVSVSISYLVERVAFTATFFSRSEALKDYVAELMLHAVRERAAACENVELIFAAAAGMERGLDEFYLRRGARLVRKAARLKLNPFFSTTLRIFSPGRFRKLCIRNGKVSR